MNPIIGEKLSNLVRKWRNKAKKIAQWVKDLLCQHGERGLDP